MMSVTHLLEVYHLQSLDRIMAELTVKAWSEPGFAQRLEADRAAVLREHGIDPDRVDFVIPACPVLADELLATTGAEAQRGGVIIMGSFSIGADPDWP